MPEEEKPEGTPPEGTPPEGTPPEGTPPETKVEEVNWEQRYKDGQAELTRKSQQVADYEREAQEREEPEPDYDGESFVDRKTVDQLIKQEVTKAVQGVRMQTADAYFRRAYPDLVKHENAISGIMRNPRDPKMFEKGISAEERIDSAVKEFNKLTEDAVATAKAESETEAKEREDKNRKAAGLGGASTAPAKSESEGLSDAEELKQRKARSAKKRGLA